MSEHDERIARLEQRHDKLADDQKTLERENRSMATKLVEVEQVAKGAVDVAQRADATAQRAEGAAVVIQRALLEHVDTAVGGLEQRMEASMDRRDSAVRSHLTAQDSVRSEQGGKLDALLTRQQQRDAEEAAEKKLRDEAAKARKERRSRLKRIAAAVGFLVGLPSSLAAVFVTAKAIAAWAIHALHLHP